MSPLSDPNWVKLVGYQHEVVHTGVLRYLLGDEVYASSVLTDMLGTPTAIRGEPRTEHKLSDFPRCPDLIAELEPGGTYLAVETKVDSTATPEQLKAEAGPPHHGVLLALGITGLAVTSPHPWNLKDSNWTVILPRQWANILARLGVESDPVLGPYLREVEREAEEHEHAREVARRDTREAQRVEPETGRCAALEHCAWLATIRDQLNPEDQHKWWTNVDRMGASMQIGLSPFIFSGVEFKRILQFVCSTTTTRRLCLKVGHLDRSVDVGPAAQRAGATVPSSTWRFGRVASPSARWVTAAYLDMTELGSCAAAKETQKALDDLDPGS